MGKGGVWLLALILGFGLGACGADDDDSAGSGGAGMGGGGGGAAASGAAGMAGGSAADPKTCAAANTSIGGPALHMNALTALTAMTASCGASQSCHQGTGKAMLSLLGKTNLREIFVGKPSCEVPTIPLVAEGGNDAALNGSWLWIKLTHPLDASGNLVADPSWGMAKNCGQMPANTFGMRMPWGYPADMMWKDIPAVRDWICGGAPGP